MQFRPIPFLGNPHVQTVLRSLLPAAPFNYPVEKRLVTVDNGDRLVLHDTTPPIWRMGDPIVILVHGLSGCHASVSVVGLASLLVPHGLRVVRVDLRGAGAGAGLARVPYTANCSHDIRAAAADMHALSPASPLILVGFSLGGNIVLKLAGEAATDPVPGLTRVAALAPPIDMVRCSDMLERRSNRLYDFYFASRMIRQTLHMHEVFPDLPRVQFPPKLRMRGFDELYTAPRHGFRDALEYYWHSSAMHQMPKIEIPTYILTARDDPFIAVEPFEKIKPRSGLTVHISERGGHLGFLGRDPLGSFRWAEYRLFDWIVNGG